MFHSIEKDDGTPQNKIFVTSVQIATPDGTLKMLGEEKSRVKDSQNSAASLMIRALHQSQLVWQLLSLFQLHMLVITRC